MFERLSEGFSGLFRKLSGKGEISEANVREAMDEVRRSLLEADVHVDVVDLFCSSVLRDALGEQVVKSLEPGQQMIGIVHRRLVELLGGPPGESSGGQPPAEAIMRITPGPTVVMLCGLQGSGKTTTCGKLAGYLRKRGRSVMLCAADLQRPAAVEQLSIVAQGVRETPGPALAIHAEPDKVAAYGKAVGIAVDVCRRALAEARKAGVDVLILDTAGRLHVNDELMGELQQINRALSPHHIFLVVDAMTGQDAVTSAKAFHQRLEVDGIILTKFDSDTRGGAALSVKHITGAPIRFVGVGEKLDALEEFHAERAAGRILGMGDVVSLVEKAQQEVSEEEAEAMQRKLAKGEMTMDDFLKQLRTLRRMGPMKQLLGLLPGVGSALKDVQIEDSELDRVEAVINSMTAQERKTPSIINNSRRKRIANGSGSTQDRVSQLVRQFTSVSTMMKQFGSMTGAGKIKAVKEMGSAGGMAGALPGISGLPGLRTRGTSHSPSVKDRFKKRKR